MTAPTCTDAGYTTYTCACGDSYVGDETEALGHDFAEATTESPKTCKVCGETEGEKLPVPDVTPDTNPTEKNHDECEAPGFFKRVFLRIGNFFRIIFGRPRKCFCGEKIPKVKK